MAFLATAFAIVRSLMLTLVIVVAVCITLTLVPPLAAQADGESGEQFSEYQVKAAFLINFIKYVEWPDEAFEDNDSPFRLGLLGSDPFGDAFELLAKKQEIGSREILVERADDVLELTECHLVFFRAEALEAYSSDLAKLKDLPLLSVGEQKGFAKQGGVINFLIVGTKVRFEINFKAAQHSKLKLSSRLLKIATKVFK
jgi:hypothetical protein